MRRILDFAGFCGGLLSLFVLILFAVEVCGAPESAGEAAPVLHSEVSAKAIAMGGAGVAYSPDVTAAFRNPGLLARVDGAEVGGMHAQLWLDTTLEYIGAAFATRYGTFAISGISIGSHEILKTNDQGNIIGTFSYRDLLALASYGITVNPSLSVGANLKVISMTLDEENGHGLGLDLGALVRQGNGGLTAGIIVQDVLNTGIAWRDTLDLVKPNVRLGLGYSLGKSLGLAVDYETNPAEWHVGGEYLLGGLLAVRAGMNPSGWTAGFGMNAGWGSADYALAEHDTLGLTHRISARFRF